MRLGLVGWATPSGNGGMNSDIAELATYVTKWLIPQHPKLPYHQPYLTKAETNTELYFCDYQSKPDCLDDFLKNIDGIIYVEHPIYRANHFGGFDIVSHCKSKDYFVLGIPMWEWWPEEDLWALQTDALWAVTSYTREYLKALSIVLESRGKAPEWSSRIYGCKWGVNTSRFRFRLRSKASRIAFVNGNGGFKCRKAADIVIPVLHKIAELGFDVSIYTQAELTMAKTKLNVQNVNFPNRRDVYANDDLFVFTSYWEGFCHGLYECAFSGGIVITTDTAPMNECLPSVKIAVEKVQSEHLSKSVKKAVPSPDHLLASIMQLLNSDCEHLSLSSHLWAKQNYDLINIIDDIYDHLAAMV